MLTLHLSVHLPASLHSLTQPYLFFFQSPPPLEFGLFCAVVVFIPSPGGEFRVLFWGKRRNRRLGAQEKDTRQDGQPTHTIAL